MLVITAAIAVAGSLAAAWWAWYRPRTVPLAPGWPASVHVLAGDGVSASRDGDLRHARFSDPFDAVISSDGTIYVSDAGAAQRIRAITRDGRVITVTGGSAGFADGVGGEAQFDTPSGLAIDPLGTIYVADTGNNAIRRIAPDGRVSTIAGNGSAGAEDGAGGEARFNGPIDVAIDRAGRIIVADTYNDRIRAIALDGMVSTIAGGARGFVDGPAVHAQFDTPSGVAVDRAGNILVADTGNGAVRTIDPNGVVMTAAISIEQGLVRPIGIAVAANGDVYVSDERGRIVETAAGGATRTLAGSSPGFRDGPAADAQFRRPAGLTIAGEGRLIVADSGNALLRLVAAESRLELRPPASPSIAPRFDADAFASLPLLWPVFPMEGPHEVAGTLGEARGGEGSERFHAGVDVRVDEGTTVLAVRDGVVASPMASGDFGSLNEWLRIGDLAYVHVRAGRTRDGEIVDTSRFVPTSDAAGKLAGVRVKRGARFSTGEVIATANPFNHVHLNVGWPGEEHNPLRFRLTQFEDHLPPTIARGGVKLFDESWQPFVRRARGRVLVWGKVRVVVDAWDQADGNRPGRRLGLYGVGYQVLNPDGSPVSGFEDGAREMIRFDRLAVDPDAPRLVYAPGSGIPFYGRRVTRFLYVATNTFRDGVATAQSWDTAVVAPGDYVIRVSATDFQGNSAIANRDLPITILAPDDAAANGRE